MKRSIPFPRLSSKPVESHCALALSSLKGEGSGNPLPVVSVGFARLHTLNAYMYFGVLTSGRANRKKASKYDKLH